MTASTDFLPFATGGGANVVSQALYAADAAVSGGFSSGIAPSAKFNKVWRQSSFVAAALANWMAGALNTNIADDGNLAGFINNFEAALATLAGNYNNRTLLTLNTALTIDQAGGLFEIDTAGIIITMPAASGNLGKTFAIYNATSGSATIVAGNFNTAYGIGVGSLTFPAGASVVLVSDGTSWNAIGGSGAYGAPVKPQTASGVGQWANLTGVSSAITLPAGGTWAYFASNAGTGYSGIAAGGTAVYSGALSNAFGFAWRIA